MIEAFTRLKVLVDSYKEPLYLDHDLAYTQHQSQIFSVFNNFRDKLDQKIDDQENPDKLTLFVQNIQAKLTFLANGIQETIQIRQTSEVKVLLKDLLDRINSTLDYLYGYYTSHFNLTARLPRGFESSEHVLAAQRAGIIISRLKELQADEDLTEILSNFFHSLKKQGDFKIKTWNQLRYLADLIDVLETFIAASRHVDFSTQLYALLIGHNFNLIEFYELIVRRIENIAVKEPELEHQVVTLKTIYQRVMDIRQERKIGFNPDVQFIGLTISEVVERKIERIEEKLDEYLEAEAAIPIEQLNDFYFSVNVTIEEILFFFRLLKRTDILNTKFNARIFAFVSRFIRTQRTDNPSKKYMRNIFCPDDMVPSRPVKGLRKRLVIIIAYIDEHFKKQANF